MSGEFDSRDYMFEARALNGSGEVQGVLVFDRFSAYIGSSPYFNEDGELCLKHPVEVYPNTIKKAVDS